MKRIYTVIVFSFLNLASFGQKEFDNWYFGMNAGISFVSGAPVSLSGGALNTNEGCTAISTAAGSLLFYTDGRYVYNMNHSQMPNGSGLNGGYSSSQSAIIIPDPADPDVYYIFTTAEMAGASGLCYSKVDMTLMGGLGNVTVKNVQLITPVDEKVAAVRNSSGNGYWIIVHELSSLSNSYYAYPVTASGVGNPVISSVGTLNTANNAWLGCMKVSPDGTKIANPRCYAHETEIADFNAATGAVTNPFLFDLGANNFTYAAEFSETGNVLYIVSWTNPPAKLYQLNMAAGSPAAILASATIIFSTTDQMGTLQLASDHKIYLAHHGSYDIGVINNPDSLGTSCNYVNHGFLSPNMVLYGLQNSISGSILLTNAENIPGGKPGLNIFPNPFSIQSMIAFNNPHHYKFSFSLFDITGQIVEAANTSSAKIILEKGNKKPGVYLFNLTNENTGERMNGKIVISD
ncbi:MAG TPA: T9SS type A sorting domain-containing protein [Bacteroidia bacterium]|nr:T9SS type A sorting domain-containing protein [Bacteroidia bacterium]